MDNVFDPDECDLAGFWREDHLYEVVRFGLGKAAGDFVEQKD